MLLLPQDWGPGAGRQDIINQIGLLSSTIGVLGIVGYVKVAALEERMIDHIPIEEMKRKGMGFYRVHQDAIEADL